VNESATYVDHGHIPIIGVNMALPMIESAGSNSYSEIMMEKSFIGTSTKSRTRPYDTGDLRIDEPGRIYS
jgi:hypothetical protein